MDRQPLAGLLFDQQAFVLQICARVSGSTRLVGCEFSLTGCEELDSPMDFICFHEGSGDDLNHGPCIHYGSPSYNVFTAVRVWVELLSYCQIYHGATIPHYSALGFDREQATCNLFISYGSVIATIALWNHLGATFLLDLTELSFNEERSSRFFFTLFSTALTGLPLVPAAPSQLTSILARKTKSEHLRRQRLVVPRSVEISSASSTVR